IPPRRTGRAFSTIRRCFSSSGSSASCARRSDDTDASSGVASGAKVPDQLQCCRTWLSSERRFPRREIRQSSDNCPPLKLGSQDVRSLVNSPSILGRLHPLSSFQPAVVSAEPRRQSPGFHGALGVLSPSRPPQGPLLWVTCGGGLGRKFVN